MERLFIAPYWVHYHGEHHCFMHLSCWRLPQAHRLLVAKGYGPRMRLSHSYPEILGAASSRPPALATANAASGYDADGSGLL